MEELYIVTRPYAGFRHPDWMAPDKRSGEGKILSLAHAGILLSSMPEISFPKLQFFRGEFHFV
jgi:hypothetical protein